MVAVPAAFAVTTPLATVAILSSLVVQLTFLLVALSGLTVAVILPVFPTVNVIVFGLTLTPVTATSSSLSSLRPPPPPPPPPPPAEDAGSGFGLSFLTSVTFPSSTFTSFPFPTTSSFTFTSSLETIDSILPFAFISVSLASTSTFPISAPFSISIFDFSVTFMESTFTPSFTTSLVPLSIAIYSIIVSPSNTTLISPASLLITISPSLECLIIILFSPPPLT